MTDHINLQKPKASKIYACTKMGANRQDINLIKALQAQGYTEHEIQNEAGVHYLVIRNFMTKNDPDFKETEAPATPETQALHDKIARLEAAQKTTVAKEDPKIAKGKKK